MTSSGRSLPLKAFFLSLCIHLVFLNVFVFTFPVARASFKPSFVFLGSILKQHDMVDLLRRERPAGSSRSFPEKSSEKNSAENLFLEEKGGNRFVPAGGRKPDFFKTVGSGEKVINKSLFDITLDMKPPAGDSRDSLEANYKIVPYKPLGLSPDDPD